jgi:hypothetical protein
MIVVTTLASLILLLLLLVVVMVETKRSQQECDEGMNLFSTPIEIANIWDGTLKSVALPFLDRTNIYITS